MCKADRLRAKTQQVQQIVSIPVASCPLPSTMGDLSNRSSRARKVLMGTCGWSDHTLLKCGKFYPASVHTAEDRLRHYSIHFPCVEVDTSTYAIPSTASITRWLRCVPKGFLFHFKAFGLFCSKSCPITALPLPIRSKVSLQCSGKDYISLGTLSGSLRDELWQAFNSGLRIAHDAGSLGVVVFQFHLSFKPTKENQVHVEWCRRNLDSHFSMAVEFRCREWFTGEHSIQTLEWLKHNRLALVAADELQHETFQKDRHQTGLPEGQMRVTLPVAWAVTQPDFIYVRVHRREGNQRLLSEAELSIWENRLKAGLSEDLKGPVYFMWGTDWEDQPVINAKCLTKKLADMAFDWKLAQQGLASRKGLEIFLRGPQALPLGKNDAEHAVDHSCGVPSKPFFPLKAEESTFLSKGGEEQMIDWHLSEGKSKVGDNHGQIEKKGVAGRLNLETATARVVANSKGNGVTKASSTALSVRQKRNKKLKRGDDISTRGSLSAITLYFKK